VQLPVAGIQIGCIQHYETFVVDLVVEKNAATTLAQNVDDRSFGSGAVRSMREINGKHRNDDRERSD
jgi:hypothetical protein